MAVYWFLFSIASIDDGMGKINETLEQLGLAEDTIIFYFGDNGAQFTVWFDENSQKPLRMESQYAKYSTKADFIAKKVSMNVEL